MKMFCFKERKVKLNLKKAMTLMGAFFCFNFPCFLQGSEKDNSPEVDFYNWYLEGTKLNAEQVEPLQKRLAKDPEDMKARVEIMSYFSHSHPESVYSDTKTRKSLKENLAWVIRNHPDSQAAGFDAFSSPFSIRTVKPDDYDELKDLWIQQTKKFSNSVNVLANASNFFMFEDEKRSEALLKAAMKLEPKNPKWPDELAHLLDLSDIKAKKENGKDSHSSDALKYEEQSASQENNEINRFYKLSDLAKYAFESRDYGKTKAYAEELLKLALKYKKNWNYGNAIFHGNYYLGSLSFEEGKLDMACHYLLEAAKTPGSPQLNSFGPDIELARQLLGKGKKEEVLTYLKSCQVFWKMGQDKLRNWIGEIEKTGTSTFKKY